MENEILKLLDKEIKVSGNWIYEPESPYVYKGLYQVPRVTEILSSTNHEQYLLNWANGIGFKHRKYSTVLEEASGIGSATHNAIEKKLQFNDELDLTKLEPVVRGKVSNAYQSFLLWYEEVEPLGFKILKEEEPLITKYFGGTLDLLVQIGDSIVLVDFKTSNHPNFKYFLQLAAYKDVLEQEYGIKIDCCMILMLDKTAIQYQEIVLDFNIPIHKEYMGYFTQAFYSSLYHYYMRKRAEQCFDKII